MKIAGYLLLLEKIEYLNKSFRLFVQRTRKQFHHFGEFMILITVEEHKLRVGKYVTNYKHKIQ